MIKEVYHWSNNNVMVFDEKGNQMPDFQGNYLEVRDKILATVLPSTKFYRADWGSNKKEISRELF